MLTNTLAHNSEFIFTIIPLITRHIAHITGMAVTRTLTRGFVYSYIHVLSDGFLFVLIQKQQISKEIRDAKLEYTNMHARTPQLTFKLRP